MSTKTKNLIGIILSSIVLVVLFTSKGGHRAARQNAETVTSACTVESK